MLNRIFFSRHYIWAWAMYTLVFGMLLRIFYISSRDDRESHWEALEEHVADVADILVSALSSMVEGGCAEDAIGDLANASLSRTIHGITLRLESGPIVASAGSPDADERIGNRLHTRRFRAAQHANDSGFELESGAYILEIIVDESDAQFAAETANTTWWLLILFVLYAWIRESALARTRYLQAR
jgi:hypothetical protein